MGEKHGVGAACWDILGSWGLRGLGERRGRMSWDMGWGMLFEMFFCCVSMEEGGY